MKSKSVIGTMASRQRGFTLMEVIMALVLGLLAISGIWGLISRGGSTARYTKACEDIRQIAGAATEWQLGQYSYSGVSMAVLVNGNYISSSLMTSSFGGTNTITGAGSRFIITTSGFTSDTECEKVRRLLVNDAASGTTPQCSGGVLSVTIGV